MKKKSKKAKIARRAKKSSSRRKSKTFKECNLCSKIKDYMEIENEQGDQDPIKFPEEIDELKIPNRNLIRYFRFDRDKLLKCPHCGTYYRHYTWTPGGSDDVFRTYIHEFVKRIGFLEAYKRLKEALHDSHKQKEEYGGRYIKEYEITSKGVKEELGKLRLRHKEIVKETIEAIRNKHEYSNDLVQRIKSYYKNPRKSEQFIKAREQEEKVAEFHAKVIAEFFPNFREEKLIHEILPLLIAVLKDDNQNVRKIIVKIVLDFIEKEKDNEKRYASLIKKNLVKLRSKSAEIQEMYEKFDLDEQKL